MSAHTGAPGLRRPQMATPIAAPALKRRAIAVAAAMLCAPALTGMALAGIGATGGGDQPAVGTLAGSQGLHGNATPVAPPPAAPADRTDVGTKLKPAGPPKAHSAEHRAPAPPAKQPVQPPAPPTHRAPAQPRSHSTPPPVYTTDPSQPGAPTDTTSTSPTTTTGSGGTSTTSSTDGSGSGSGSGSNSYTYPGGG
jgi:hypothetical protein